MNKKFFFFISLVTLLSIVFSLFTSSVMAAGDMLFAASSAFQQQISSPTPNPLEPSPVAPDRILPPVGSNAGLLVGVSLLVLIIIGGVVWSSRRSIKH